MTEPLPESVEGGSFAAVLSTGKTAVVSRPRDEYVVHFPHYDKDPTGPSSAILLGDFKLIRSYESGALHLHDITRDIRERNDLSTEMPNKVAELNRRFDDYLKSVKAQMPVAALRSDPSKPAETNSREIERKIRRMTKIAAVILLCAQVAICSPDGKRD